MTVRATGIAEVVAHLVDVQSRSRDLRPVLEVAAADTVAIIDDAFETSASPSGELWAPLADSTVRRRRQGSAKPLVDTGRLRTSASARAEGATLRFGTNTPYAIFHQGGNGRMRRQFLPLDGEPGAYVLGRSGAALEHWDRVRAAVKRYVLTGEVS